MGHVQGGDQVDPGVVPQEAVGAVLDHGAQVDGVHHLHVGILLHNGPDGGENGLHGGAIVLRRWQVRVITCFPGKSRRFRVSSAKTKSGCTVVFMASMTVLPVMKISPWTASRLKFSALARVGAKWSLAMSPARVPGHFFRKGE